MSGLQCFSPRLRRLEIDGRRFEIGPVRLRDLPRFARAATRLLPAILAGDILTVLEDDLAAARDLVASGAGIADPEWLDGIDSGAFIDLLDAVLEVNLDFFVRRTLPGVRRMTARVGFPTLRLIRVAIGDWRVDGLLPGQWRALAERTQAPARPRSGGSARAGGRGR